MKKKKHYDVEISSGNVFADLGLANPEDALAKAQLAIEIAKIIKKRKLTQSKVAKILKIAQPKVSLLLRGYLKSFSVLKTPVDTFFDKVMVMVDDAKLRRGRLALLRDLREAMNRVADISRLAQ